MAELFTYRQIVEAALRRVGDYAPSDAGAKPDTFSIAADNLDRMLAHYSAISQFQWMIPVAVTVPIPASTNPIDIVDESAGDIPDKTFLALDQMVLRHVSGGRDYPLERISRRDYFEKIEQKAGGGMPQFVYIDRTMFNPLVYLYPVLTLTGYALHLTYFRQSVERPANPNVNHGFDRAWQLWMDYQLSYIIGTGPVIVLDAKMMNECKTFSEKLYEQLHALYNHETKRPRRVTPWSF